MEEVKKQGMESLFVPYEIALALKELGFDEPCLRTYTWNGFDFDVLTCISDNVTTMEKRLNSNNDKYTCSAPLYSQAFRWFREKYKLDIISRPHIGKSKKYVCDPVNFRLEAKNTLEEAELECLKKLIEICCKLK